jgi:hypothetical protein
VLQLPSYWCVTTPGAHQPYQMMVSLEYEFTTSKALFRHRGPDSRGEKPIFRSI